MHRKLDICLLVLTAVLFLLPQLHLLGVRERFVELYGFEDKLPTVVFSAGNWFSRRFQRNFEERFGMRFFLRKSFLKIKNQLFEWCNAGYFHSGYSGRIVTGKDHQLLETTYLRHYFGDLNFEEDAKQTKNFMAVKQIADKLNSLGIDFVYILAPDKVRMFPDLIPAHIAALLRRQSSPIYAPYCAVAREKYGIPCFDACAFLQPFKGKFELYPRRGTHWNARGAHLVINRIFEDLNRRKTAGSRYPVPSAEFVGTSRPRYNDNDLQGLLNLLYDPAEYNTGLVPVFPKIPPQKGEIIVFGDSYAHQLALLLNDMGCFEKVHNLQNCFADEDWFRRRLPRVKLFLLVYTTPKLYAPYRYRDVKTIADSLPQLFPGTMLLAEGFHAPESWGVWGTDKCTARIVLPPGRRNKIVRLRFDLEVSASMRFTEVYFRGKKAAVWRFPRDKKADLFLDVPPSQDIAELEFRNFDACIPAFSPLYDGSRDERRLGLAIRRFTVFADGTAIPGILKKARWIPGTIVFTQGFYPPGVGGVWGKERCTAKIILPESRKSEKVQLSFEIGGSASMKHTDVYCGGKKVAVWRFPQDKEVRLDIDVPLDRKMVELDFRNYDVCVPSRSPLYKNARDLRSLGLIIRSFSLVADRTPYLGIFEFGEISSKD